MSRKTNQTNQIRSIGKRAGSLMGTLKQALVAALSLMMLAGIFCIGAPALTASATGTETTETDASNIDSDNPYRLKQVWVWHRVKKQGDLPDYVKGGNNTYSVIVADPSGRYYNGSGNGEYPDDDDSWCWIANDWNTQNGWFGSLTGSDEFITPYLPTSWYIEVTDTKDSKNQNAKKVLFWNLSGSTWQNIYAKSDDDLWIASGKADKWSFYTTDLGGKYAKGLDSDKVHIYYETGGRDPQWKISGKYLWGEPDKDYDDGGEFIVWWGEQRNISCVDAHLTVQTGDVMNVDSGVMFQPVVNTTSGYQDIVITVEPGAVLSIEGTLYNNAIIHNYGTIIVQKNSAILSFFPHDKDNKYNENYGQIICDGGTYVKNGQSIQGEGNLLVLEGGKIDLNRANDRLILKNGATAEINGVICAPGSIQVLDSELYIRSKGAVLCGYGRSTRYNQAIATAKVNNAGTSGVSLSGITLSTFSINNGTAIYTTAKTKITVDGYLKVASGAVRVKEGNNSRPVAVNLGSGTTETPEYMSKDANGNRYYTETVNGQTITYTYYDNTSDLVSTKYNATTGETIYYYRNEAVKSVQKDGSYVFTFPQGEAFVVSTITYQGGATTKQVLYFDGAKETVPSGADDLDLAYGDLTALAANGIDRIEKKDDGSVVTYFLNGNIFTVLGDNWLWQYTRENDATYFTRRYTASSEEYEDRTWNGIVYVKSPTFERTTYPESVSEIQEIYKDLTTGQITTIYYNGDKMVEEADGSYYMVYEDGTYEQKFSSGVTHIWKYRKATAEDGTETQKLIMNIWKDSSGWYITPAEGKGKGVVGYASEGEDACFEQVYEAVQGTSDISGYAYLTNWIKLASGKVLTFSNAVWYSRYDNGFCRIERKDGVTISLQDSAEGTEIQSFNLPANTFKDATIYDAANGEIYLETLQIHVPCTQVVVMGTMWDSVWEVYALNADLEAEDIIRLEHVLSLRQIPHHNDNMAQVFMNIRYESSKPCVSYSAGMTIEYAPEYWEYVETGVYPTTTRYTVDRSTGDLKPADANTPNGFSEESIIYYWAATGPIYNVFGLHSTQSKIRFTSLAGQRILRSTQYNLRCGELLLYVNNGTNVSRHWNFSNINETGLAQMLKPTYTTPETMFDIYRRINNNYFEKWQDLDLSGLSVYRFKQLMANSEWYVK